MDKRYEVGVAGLSQAEVATKMQAAIVAVQQLLPANTGVAVFAFDFAPGDGLAYISNAQRADMMKALSEFMRKQRGQN